MERIMAIDPGKFKSVVCNYLAPSGAHDFVTIKTCPQVLHDLLVEQEPDVVVVEVCGIIGWVHDLVRSLLVEVCWLAQQWNPWVRQCYERTARGSKTRKKIAIVAVGRRLLVRMWAMLRDGTAWRMPELRQTVKE